MFISGLSIHIPADVLRLVNVQRTLSPAESEGGHNLALSAILVSHLQTASYLLALVVEAHIAAYD